jgi:hypothetical protein
MNTEKGPNRTFPKRRDLRDYFRKTFITTHGMSAAVVFNCLHSNMMRLLYKGNKMVFICYVLNTNLQFYTFLCFKP